jgi:Zn-dependent peptidase ImmA (M78 family)
MSSDRKQLALEAISQAVKVRKRAKCDPRHSLCVLDLCESLGVSVLLQDIPSMEGFYMPEASPRPTIILSSLRPAGRRAMTCGHEFGHHEFKHGKRWDELKEERTQSRRFEPDEYLADMFSAYLLMPKTAVEFAFRSRQLNPETCSSAQLFALSTYFGVSYEAFIIHLERTLSLITMQRASALTTHTPKELRHSILGDGCPHNLIVADPFWAGRAIDAEVGDYVLVSAKASIEGSCVELVSRTQQQTVVKAVASGTGRVAEPTGWCSFVRVMRKGYVGRAMFRHDEEIEDG